MKTLGHEEESAIEALLMGRTAVRVTDDTLLLDDGTTLQVVPNDGGCLCGAGDYDLTELNGVDNIITRVEFVEGSAGDFNTAYRIFVLADNQRINLLTVEGDDGNGWYGTGYEIVVRTKDAS